jgi:hypothetical protein
MEDVEAARSNQGALPWLSARAQQGSAFTCDPGFDMIVSMDLADWVEEAESLLRRDGLWPEQDEERNPQVRDQSVTSRWVTFGRR